ncbi:MAG: hypothetical protein ACRDRO_02050 [Pseudonocardiaceae bacterium]
MSLRRGQYGRRYLDGWAVTVDRLARRLADALRRRSGGCGMSALTLAVVGPCPQSADGRPHTWRPGDSTDLISYGLTDHGASVYLGRCRFCVVPLLAVVLVSEDLRSGGPFVEIHGTEL